TLAHRVEDDVVGVAGLGKVLSGVVNDCVGPQRLHQFHIRGTADAGDIRPEGLRKLNGRGAYGSRSTIDQDVVSTLNPPLSRKNGSAVMPPSQMAAASS